MGVMVGGTSTTCSLQGSLKQGPGWPWVCVASVPHTSPCAAVQLGQGLVEILSSLGAFPWETVRGLPPQ